VRGRRRELLTSSWFSAAFSHRETAIAHKSGQGKGPGLVEAGVRVRGVDDSYLEGSAVHTRGVATGWGEGTGG